jgi:pimeloyl-ACP methyl ester carboxylesterase
MVFMLKFFLYALTGVAGLVFTAFLFSQWQSRQITSRYPNIGELIDIGGFRLNSLHVPRPVTADLPTLLFIHGASGNLRDPMAAFLKPLEGRAEMLFVDRPGHGYSERGDDANLTPDGQADAIARLLDVEWYYDLANTPYLGPLFCNTVALPAGLLRIREGVKSVFHPNPVPAGYLEGAAIPLVLRPDNFCNNARDVANLLVYVRKTQPHYHEIAVPTVIITGDSDEIVYEELHSLGLNRDIKGSELVWVKGLGHKPDYVATDLAITAIEKVAGMDRDLRKLASDVERRIAPH